MVRERMGSGGPRGLQILRSGALSARGGFDSHAFPPLRGLAVLLGVALLLALGAAAPRGASAQSAPFARPDSTAGPDTAQIISRARFMADTAAADTTVFESPRDSARSARADSVRARRVPPPRLTGWNTPSLVMLRSLVFPGGGQIHNRAWLKAGAIGGGEALLVARIVQDKRALNDLNERIDAARAAHDTALEQSLVGDYNSRSDQYVGRQWWLGALLAYSLLDAYIDAHFRNFRVDLTDDPALPPEDRGAAGLRLSWQERF